MMTPELWAKLTSEQQFRYAMLMEGTLQSYMRECGEPEVTIHGFPELGDQNTITVDLQEADHAST